MTFLKNLKEVDNVTATWNGAVAFKSTMNANLDFFSAAGSKRIYRKDYGYQERTKQSLSELFYKAFNEDKTVALKNLIYLRDINEGLKEKGSFRYLMKELVKVDQEAFNFIALHTSEFGRWDDITNLLMDIKPYKDSYEFLLRLVASQLNTDLENMKEGKPVSLLAKWLPSIGKQYKHSRVGTEYAYKLFDGNKKSYRKTVAALRKHIHLVEHNLVNKDYSFDYTKLPALALTKYTKAFQRNDLERYNAFKQEITKKPSLISDKADKLMPYEILQKIRSDKELANALWASLPNDILEGNTIVVVDGSGSMTRGAGSVPPCDVATSLAIYASERLSGEFKDKFITFSRNPKLVEVPSTMSFSDKVSYVRKFDEIANTDIDKTFKLLFDTSLKTKEEDRLDTIIIVSDMQFDSAVTSRHNQKSIFDKWKRKFEENGMKMPKTIFWNVNQSKVDFPTTDIDNLYLVAGFSQNLFKDIVKHNVPTATEFMLTVLSKYDKFFE